jgi:CheY-like chemotaxis protein
VEATSNGLDAVRKIREHHFDLVLLDYRTPEIDGLAAARLVGELFREEVRPRLIALTASPEKLLEWEAASGKVFDEVIGKSTNLPNLLVTINRSLHPGNTSAQN